MPRCRSFRRCHAGRCGRWPELESLESHPTGYRGPPRIDSGIPASRCERQPPYRHSPGFSSSLGAFPEDMFAHFPFLEVRILVVEGVRLVMEIVGCLVVVIQRVLFPAGQRELLPDLINRFLGFLLVALRMILDVLLDGRIALLLFRPGGKEVCAKLGCDQQPILSPFLDRRMSCCRLGSLSVMGWTLACASRFESRSWWNRALLGLSMFASMSV